MTIHSFDTDRTYYFRVKAYCVAGGVKISSGYSPIVHESPGKPTCPAAAATSYNEINVSFSNSGIYRKTGYEIWRSTSLKGEYICVGTILSYMESPEIHSFDDIGVATGKTYYYKVRAYKQVGALKTHGAFSDIVWARATLEIPDWFIAGGSGATSVTASWNAVDGASGYELWRATAVSGVFKLLKCTTALSYKNTGLVTDQPYYYKVRAYRYVSGRRVYSDFTDVLIATPSDF
jgi:fibronectin type 3 domain-containing protein